MTGAPFDVARFKAENQHELGPFLDLLLPILAERAMVVAMLDFEPPGYDPTSHYWQGYTAAMTLLRDSIATARTIA